MIEYKSLQELIQSKGNTWEKLRFTWDQSNVSFEKRHQNLVHKRWPKIVHLRDGNEGYASRSCLMKFTIELVVFVATKFLSIYVTPSLESVPNANEHCVFAALSISRFFSQIQSHNVECLCSHKLTVCSDLRKLDLNFSVRWLWLLESSKGPGDMGGQRESEQYLEKSQNRFSVLFFVSWNIYIRGFVFSFFTTFS